MSDRAGNYKAQAVLDSHVSPPPPPGDMVHDEGHPHLIDGEFQSDKYPACPRGKVPLSVKDKTAQDLLWEYAQRRRSVDAEFSADLELALTNAGFKLSPGDMVLVPRDDTKRSFADPLLPREMVAAGEDAIDKAHEDLQNYVSGKTIDWDSGMIAVAVYRAMVEWWCRSAPSIHQGGCAPIVTDGVQGDTAALAASPREAIRRGIVAAKILVQNSISCVREHHGRNTAADGLPPWLKDCQRDVLALESALRTGERQ